MCLPFDCKLSRILRGCLGDASAMHRRCFGDASGTEAYRESFGDASPKLRQCFGDASAMHHRRKFEIKPREYIAKNVNACIEFFCSTRDVSRCQKQSHDVADASPMLRRCIGEHVRDVSRSSKSNIGSTSRVHRERKKA